MSTEIVTPDGESVASLYPQVCNLCFPGAVDVGELVPGFFLARLPSDEYIVGDGNFHDAYIKFVGTPRPEPSYSAKKMDAWNQWIDDASASDFTLLHEGGIRYVYEFTKACMKVGYRPKVMGGVEVWIYERAGRLINGK